MGEQERIEPPAPVSEASGASGELSRRDFMKGAAAAGVVVGADEYVKPTLKMLGVSRLAAAASTPPPPPPPPNDSPKKGCTPGFWGNNSSGGQGGGVDWWDSSPDGDWVANGGSGTNPFHHNTPFTPFFASHPLLVGATMWFVVNGGGGDQPARRAARQLVAAYLNASFSTYAYTRNQLSAMWSQAVLGGNSALNALSVLLDATNNACDAQ